MADIESKQQLIIAYETAQARRLADGVIQKPLLTVWYILIPVIFVFYFYRLNRYAASRREFVAHIMRSRRSAVEAAAEAVASGRPPAIDAVMERTSTPREARGAFKTYMRVLIEHYMDLFKARGSDFDALLRSAYRTRSNYLLFLNRLNQVEKELDKALAPGLVTEHPTVGETIALIEQQIARLRRGEAERLFP